MWLLGKYVIIIYRYIGAADVTWIMIALIDTRTKIDNINNTTKVLS